jgi:hypothetical protein
MKYPSPKNTYPKKMSQFRNFFKVSSGTFFRRTEDDILGRVKIKKKQGKKKHFFSEKEALFLRKRSKIEWGCQN